MKLVCHIGTPKTASTHLQNTLAANPAWMARHGMAYGDVLAPDPNHITLFYACSSTLHDFVRAFGLNSQGDITAFRDRLAAHLDSWLAGLPESTQTVILSSENLSANLFDIEGITRLHDLLSPRFDEIEIAVYLRRQDDAILSMYSEHMRRGFRGHGFELFVERCLTTMKPTPYLYYRKMLQNWIEVWGQDRLRLRRFERGDFPGGDIVADFASLALGETPEMEGLTPSDRENASLGSTTLETLRLMHRTIPFVKDGGENPVRRRIAEIVDTLPPFPRPVMDAGTAARIMAHFEPANRWVAETFFPERGGTLFEARTDLPETGNIGQATAQEVADIMGLIINRMARQK